MAGGRSPEPERTMRTITAGGVRLECRWWGIPGRAGPTLVLLHEGLGCVAMWRDFPARLHARTGLRVFAWSRAGYGGSDPAALPRRTDYMHVEGRHGVGAVLGAAGIDDAVLVGHSDGASIAIVYAGERGMCAPREGAGSSAIARSGEHGMRADQWVPGSPAIVRTGEPMDDLRLAGAPPAPVPRTDRHVDDSPPPRIRALVLLAPHVFCEDVSIESIRAAGDAYRRNGLRERLARYHGDQVDAAFFGWHDAWLLPGFRHWSIQGFLPGIAVPVLLIQGERDAYGTVAQLDAIGHGVAGPVTRRWLAGCGHAPHRERPDETLDAVEAFLAYVAPRGEPFRASS